MPPVKPPARILMTACGAPGAPCILKCLRNNGERDVFVYGVDMNEDAVGFGMVDASGTCPPGRSEGFIDALLEIVRRERLQVVLPLSTMELDALAAAKERFAAAGAAVLVSDAAGLAVANNKGTLMEAAAAAGVPVPRFIRVRTLDEFRSAVRELGFPSRSVCFKPEFGKGGRGFRILAAGRDRFAELFEQKPGGCFETFENAVEILAQRETIPPLLVMEYLPGEEYSVDVLCLDGRMLACVPRVREVIKLGICFIGTVRPAPALADAAARLVEALGLSYCINFQFKLDEHGTAKLLEANPRVSGTIVLAAAAGVNLPYLAVKLGLGEPVSVPEPRWGTRMVRYWEEVFFSPDGEAFTIPPGPPGRRRRGGEAE
ncbi:MAG: ATP-grasp domain-containing protein [Planctomycetes bacterium]|nr:ATP-grasp domain-containing protein [Planctomycetota bacterium]